MPGRPSIQFYFSDWRANQKLRFCSWGARGVWIEVMGLMHDSAEYGVLRKSLKDIAQALGAPMKLLNELVTQGVMYGCASGTCEPMVYRPRHGRTEGDPVVLIEAQEGPIWYSPRMVRDEYVRSKRGEQSRFGDEPNPSPKGGIGASPTGSPSHRKGDGASTSSSSSSSELGSSSARGEISKGARSEGGQAGAPAGEAGPGPGAVTDEQAGAAVRASIALRRIGMRCQPQDPFLLALAAEGFTEQELALVAAEKALKTATLWNDPDVHPELHTLLASGANQQQMGLTSEQYGAVRSAAADVGTAYLAKTLRGRRRDAEIAAAENAAGRAASTRGKPSATDQFKGKTYAGTDIEQLAPEFRRALEREQAGDD